MKKFFALCIFTALAASAPLATEGNFGAGLMLGDPTGFDFKLWTVPKKTALDFNIGWGGWWGYDGYGFTDPNCYNNGYYNTHTNQCLDVSTYGPGGQYGWHNFHLHGDYLIHNFNLIQARERFPVYYGPGLALDYWRGGYYYPGYSRDGGFTQVGVRGVAGISWLPRHAPIDLFLELAPVIEIFPFPDFRVDGGFGARYWF